MIFDTDKALLKRYRHITAALIESKTSKTISRIFASGISILLGNAGSTTTAILSTSTAKSSKALPGTNRSAQAGFDWRVAHAKDR